MINVKLTLEYDGKVFHGWQKQPAVETAQESLQQALSTVLREPISHVIGSGRTDSGVHARGQVANFYCSKEPDLHALIVGVSSLLRGKLSVLDACIVPEEFHALRSATKKQYSYHILNRRGPAVLQKGRVWVIHGALDRDAMQKAAEVYVGTKDYAGFRSAGCVIKNTIKTIHSSSLKIDDDYLTFTVIGSGFLYNMVRIMAGTLVDIGLGVINLEDLNDIIASKDRLRSGRTAPPHGLYMDRVFYDDAE